MITELQKAKQSAFRLLKFRLRSKQELRQRLKLKKFSQPVIAEVLDFLSDLGYLDDLAFCRAWINDRIHLKPRSRKMIEIELRRKGITPAIIDQAFAQTKIQTDETIALELAEKKYENMKKLKTEVLKRRLSGYLLRRGFSSSVTFKIIKGLIDNDK